VPRTKDRSPLFLLSGSGNVLRFLVLLLALAATAAFGQESVLTLAMLSYDQSPARTTAVARYDSPANPLSSDSAPRLEYPVAGVKPDLLNVAAFSFDVPLKNQNVGYRRDWQQSIYKRTNGKGWTGFLGHIQAGYGQFCRLESCFGKRIIEMQGPPSGYLMARFSF
jgi:hypothetical protein